MGLVMLACILAWGYAGVLELVWLHAQWGWWGVILGAFVIPLTALIVPIWMAVVGLWKPLLY